MSYLAKAKDINDKVLSGQLLDAFEQYYHNDVVMIEANGNAVRRGLERFSEVF